jgi:hypothetical protein
MPPTSGRACWRGGGSLDLKCYCFNALTDEGMRVVSRRTALWGCAKVKDKRMRAVRHWAHIQEVQHAGWSKEACCGISKHVSKLLCGTPGCRGRR